MKAKTNERIEECYNHIMPYIKEEDELKEMCKNCGNWCGENHDYTECKNMMCFKFYLCFAYLEWMESWE